MIWWQAGLPIRCLYWNCSYVTNKIWKQGLSIFYVPLANIMFLRGSFAVELFYDFADTRHCQLATSLIFSINIKQNSRRGSMPASSSLSKHHVSRFSHSRTVVTICWQTALPLRCLYRNSSYKRNRITDRGLSWLYVSLTSIMFQVRSRQSCSMITARGQIQDSY